LTLYAKIDSIAGKMIHTHNRSKRFFAGLLACAFCAALCSCSPAAPEITTEPSSVGTAEIPADDAPQETEPIPEEAAETLSEEDCEACGMTLFGIPLGQWTLVYPEEYEPSDKHDVGALAKLLTKMSGQDVALSDSLPEKGHAVLIGKASPLTPRTDDLSYIVRWDGENLHIGGNSYWADCRALYQELIYGELGADYKLNPPDEVPVDVSLTEKDASDPSHDRAFSIQAWCCSGDAFDTEALVKQAAEAGFTKVLIRGASDTVLCRNLMKWCAIYDLEILWTGAGVSASNMDRTSWEEQKHILIAPHVWGIYLSDEPNRSQFKSLANSVKKFADYTAKVAFINLFPTGASAEQLGNPTYRAHVEEFFETVPVTCASFDHYPLNPSGLNGDYMENLQIFATECQKREIPFGVYLQSVCFAPWKRTPSEADIEWQMWCIRSFGASEAGYFTYMTPYSDTEDFQPALIDHDLNPTERWYAAQRINGEFAALDEAFARYPKWLGAFSLGAGTSNRNAFMRFDDPYDFSGVLPDIDSEHQLLIGCFTNADGKYAFTVVNCEELQRKRTASARIRTDAPVTLWQNGVSSRNEPEADGYITIELACGEGVFCEIGD